VVELLAALIIGHAVPVICVDRTDFAGYWTGTRIELSSTWACPGLKRTASDRQRGLAFLTVLHEAFHAAGVADEHEATCRALTIMPRFLRALKVARRGLIVHAAWKIQAGLRAPYGGPCISAPVAPP